jgi:hypothetical protein
VPPVALVPVAPVPVPVVVFEPGRRRPVSLIVPAALPVLLPLRPRLALSLIAPVPVVELEPLVPVAPVPDIDPEAPMPVSAPVVPLVPAALPAVPTSPPLVPAVLSRLLPLLQAPTVSTAASASMLLPIVILRMALVSPRCCVMKVAASPAGGHPNGHGATRIGEGRKTGATLAERRPVIRVAM